MSEMEGQHHAHGPSSLVPRMSWVPIKQELTPDQSLMISSLRAETVTYTSQALLCVEYTNGEMNKVRLKGFVHFFPQCTSTTQGVFSSSPIMQSELLINTYTHRSIVCLQATSQEVPDNCFLKSDSKSQITLSNSSPLPSE